MILEIWMILQMVCLFVCVAITVESLRYELGPLSHFNQVYYILYLLVGFFFFLLPNNIVTLRPPPYGCHAVKCCIHWQIHIESFFEHSTEYQMCSQQVPGFTLSTHLCCFVDFIFSEIVWILVSLDAVVCTTCEIFKKLVDQRQERIVHSMNNM